MRNLVSEYALQFRQDRQKQIKLGAVLAALAVIVAGVVFWQLHNTGVAMTNEVFCGQEEHIHDDACYEKVLFCDVEDEDHVHDDSCFETVLTCEIPEHTHTVECLIDESADVETAENWEATLPEDLSGIWADDVVAIAESQVGYTESTANFQLADDGETHMGYTRYGAWYGNSYGDWDAMFVSFCLNYAGVPEEVIPENSGAYALTVALEEQDLYVEDTEFTPASGDLAFFDIDEDGRADGVGIIEELITDSDIDDNGGSIVGLKVIEGNYEDAVCENEYDIGDMSIVGYGILPDQDDSELIPADETALIEENGGDEITPDDSVSEVAPLADKAFPDANGDYTIEYGLTFTITGNGTGTWSVISNSTTDTTKDPAEAADVIKYTISGADITITGNCPGTATLSYGSNEFTVTVKDTVRVYVYVAALMVDEDGKTTDQKFSDKMLSILGIDPNTIDGNNYFPAGEIELDWDFMRDKGEAAVTSGEPLITEESDWVHLLEELHNMDTSTLIDMRDYVFDGKTYTGDGFIDYTGNRGNSLNEYMEYAVQDIGYKWGSEHTALFKWHDYDSIAADVPNQVSWGFEDQTVLYHLDLRFNTNTVTYVYGNNGISSGTGQDGTVAVEEETYISGVTIHETSSTYEIPKGYMFGGYYRDEDFTIPWNGEDVLVEDEIIYIKLIPEIDITVNKTTEAGNPLDGAEFLLYWIEEDTTSGEDPTYTTYYYSEDAEGHEDWVTDRNEATRLSGSTFTVGLGQDITYYLEEVKAPDGFTSLGVIQFTVTDSGIVEIVSPIYVVGPNSEKAFASVSTSDAFTLDVINLPETVIYKYTGESGSEAPLGGAEFVLKRTETDEYGLTVTLCAVVEDGEVVNWVIDENSATVLSSGEDGYINLSGLNEGSYMLTETKAPDGYLLIEDPVEFTIDGDGNITSGAVATVDGQTVMAVYNEPGKELPNTGGTGTWIYTVAGLVLIGSAATLLVYRKRRVV